MNFLGISQAVYRRTKLGDTPSLTDVTRIQQFINQRYRKILAKPGMDQFRDTTVTFATVANQKRYGLPASLMKIRDLYDQTNQRRILPRTLDWLRNVDPGLTAVSAFSENWIPLQGWGAELQELTATGVGLWVVSDNAADTTQHVYLETTRLGGVRAGTAVGAGTALNGTTRVQIGSLTDHTEIIRCYLDLAGAGTVSVFDAATNGNQLTSLSPGRTNARFYMIQLYPTPSAAVTITVDCQRGIEHLSRNTEEPLFPEDFHMILVHGAAYDEWRQRDDDRAAAELAEMNTLLLDLRQYVTTSPDELPVQRGPRALSQRISRLGGYFPAGT